MSLFRHHKNNIIVLNLKLTLDHYIYCNYVFVEELLVLQDSLTPGQGSFPRIQTTGPAFNELRKKKNPETISITKSLRVISI